jgi:hypothetical protein
MLNIELFVSCGSDRDGYRDIAKDAFERLQQVIQFEMGLDATIAYWDYRMATPTIVARGALASTSLANVDRANALVAIFGRRVPTITREEIRRAFERRRGGERQEVFVFVHPGLLSPRHATFFREVEDDFGETIVFSPYTNQVTFQALLYTTMFKYFFGQLGTANPALLTGAP